MKKRPSKWALILAPIFLIGLIVLGKRQQPTFSADTFLEAKVAGVVQDDSDSYHTIILVEKKDFPKLLGAAPSKAIFITVGEREGQAILMALGNQKFVRPLTHELASIILNRFDIHIKGIYIHSMQKETYFARLELEGKKSHFSFDCRPSDGIALAVRAKAPIWIGRKVFSETAIAIPHLPKHRPSQAPKSENPEKPKTET
ncbi:MAG: bifunctional nuclease family protein [Elusimicrobia bacterium]|nr:bifunctional nuclease family protein [Elusimicrobiota bacterium]